MGTYPSKGRKAYHIHLTEENKIYLSPFSYYYYKIIRKDNK